MCLVAGTPALADTAVASRVVASPGGMARATIAPGDGDASVLVEHREGEGWRQAWRGRLQAGAAGQVLLDDGGHLLAFDDATREGEHAIVLYAASGQLLRAVDLGEFLPQDYLRALPRDAGILHWRGATAPTAAQAVAVFDVAAPGGGALRFSIGFDDGLVRTAQIREYLAAADQARALAAKQRDVAEPVAAAAVAGGPLGSR
jgi:hypothetical protein